jgi:hypothetical protein
VHIAQVTKVLADFVVSNSFMEIYIERDERIKERYYIMAFLEIRSLIFYYILRQSSKPRRNKVALWGGIRFNAFRLVTSVD